MRANLLRSVSHDLRTPLASILGASSTLLENELGEETRLGEGRVNFRALFEKLRALGYDSWVTIEREIDGEQQEKDVCHARDVLAAIIGEVYGG